MEILLSRSSVCAGDDVESHDKRITLPDGLPLDAIIERVVASSYLPCIAGGKATWSVWATIFEHEGHSPVAVVAQEWETTRLLTKAILYRGRPELSLRFRYHAQQEPTIVYEVLCHV